MTTDAWVSLLIQVPLVGIFIWFTLKLNEQNQTAATKRDDEWRGFLKEQREASNAALARIAEEVKTLSNQQAQMQALFIAHDESIRSHLPSISRAVDKVINE